MSLLRFPDVFDVEFSRKRAKFKAGIDEYEKDKMDKITNLGVWEVLMKLGESGGPTFQERREITNVFLKIDTDLGITSFGILAPDEDAIGETVNLVITQQQYKMERAASIRIRIWRIQNHQC